MRVCLFEDRGALCLEPLTLTRPVFDLLCGQTSLGHKQCRAFGPDGQVVLAALVRPHLADLVRLRSPGAAVNDFAWLRAGPVVLVNGRWLPPVGARVDASIPGVGVTDDEVAYAVLDPKRLHGCSADTLDDCLETWKATLPRRPAGGQLVQYLWDLVEHNAEQIALDHACHGSQLAPPPVLSAVVGPTDRLVIDPTARIDPLVVADTSGGPVVIAAGAFVGAFSRLEGPCYVGPGSQVHGARLRAGTTLGPQCRVGGEVEASILQGYSNKYHDGFLGHAYVGEWVNLGAGTQNSDLRNDYGEVKVTVNGALVAAGRTKIGCFLGDHTKSAIGTLLNTGTNVGAFCNLLPEGLLPRHVPSFARAGSGRLTENGDLELLLQTAAAVMARRGVELTAAHAEAYRAVYEQTAEERRAVLRDAEMRALRRSA
jgi:UDP-N-acetylglucosamine diphosphorylase/glucosamine-1-phosphate N-acetyltransferase